MQTVGQLLRTTREERQLTLEEVGRKTKIRMRYLRALEGDDYRVLPSAVVAKGFIKNYGQLLNLPIVTLLALFRRDFIETETGQVVPRGIVKPLNMTPTLSWTPTKTVVLVVGLAALLLGGYFVRQIVLLQANPNLVVDRPIENQVLVGHTVSVSGQTDPDATVMVNQQLANVKSSGSFQAVIELPSGEDTILVVAVSKSKKTTRVVRIVKVQ